MLLIRYLDNQHRSGTIMFNKCNMTARNRLGFIKWIQLIINVVVFTVYCYSQQLCVWPLQLNHASWREQKCPNFETVAKGDSIQTPTRNTQALSIASPGFYRRATALHNVVFQIKDLIQLHRHVGGTDINRMQRSAALK